MEAAIDADTLREITAGLREAKETRRLVEQLETENARVYAGARPDRALAEEVSTFTRPPRRTYPAAYLEQVRAVQRGEIRAIMTVGTDPEGGSVALSHFDLNTHSVAIASNPILGLIDAPTITANAYEQPLIDSRIEAVDVGEVTDRPDTPTPTFKVGRWPLYEKYLNWPVSQWLEDDASINLAQVLENVAGRAFGLKRARNIVGGDGVGRERGLTTYPTAATADATRAFGTVEHIASGDASGFLAPTTAVSPADCFIRAVYRLEQFYRANASWVMNSATLAAVSVFKDAQGRHIWVPAREAGMPSMLLGYPVYEEPTMPDIGGDALPILFGDLRSAYVAPRRAARLLRDPYTAKPFVNWYFTMRTGGDVRDTAAYKAIKIATS